MDFHDQMATPHDAAARYAACVFAGFNSTPMPQPAQEPYGGLKFGSAGREYPAARLFYAETGLLGRS